MTVPTERGFEAFVHKHERYVQVCAYRVLRDWQRAEEVAQVVFMEALKKLHWDWPESRQKHWVAIVACKRAIDEARKWKRQPPPDLPTPKDASSPAERLFTREQRERLRQAIAGINDAQRRAAFIDHYLKALPITGIARDLGKPQSTVRDWLRQDRAMIAQRLKET